MIFMNSNGKPYIGRLLLGFRDPRPPETFDRSVFKSSVVAVITLCTKYHWYLIYSKKFLQENILTSYYSKRTCQCLIIRF